MGSPLGPTLANIFMCHYEKIWLQDCPTSFKPCKYFRYVDDTLLLFRSSDHIKLFLNYLNDKHPNIKFTHEVESNGSLPFLDINISRDNNYFTTSVYRKPTYTGLTTKFSSYIPIKYKSNLVSILIYRAFKISKNYHIFHQEVEFIISILKLNSFPLNFIFNIIRKTVNKLVSPQSTPLSVSKDIIYMKLPYLGSLSHSLGRKLCRIVHNNYSTVKLKIVYTTSTNIGNFFKFKDRIPTALCSSIVYKFSCDSCNAIYVGKTTRNFFMRMEDHTGFSYRNKNLKLSSPTKSSIRHHSFLL